MTVIARFSIPAAEFELGEVLEVREGIQVRLETTIPVGDTVIPYLWIPIDDVDAVESALRDSPLAEDVRVVDEVGSEALLRVRWSEELDGLVDAFRGSEAVILDGRGLGDRWSFKLRFPGHEELSGFYRTCLDKGIPLELDELRHRFDPGDSETGTAGMSQAQRETLLAALEAGYFDVPRKVTLRELAERFNVSDTAISQRLRRGLKTLLSSYQLDESISPPDGDRPRD